MNCEEGNKTIKKFKYCYQFHSISNEVENERLDFLLS